MYHTEQAAAEYIAVSSQGFMETLAVLSRDTEEFLRDNPVVIVWVVALAVFFFYLTRPRTN
jgi:hypothetical protein